MTIWPWKDCGGETRAREVPELRKHPNCHVTSKPVVTQEGLRDRKAPKMIGITIWENTNYWRIFNVSLLAFLTIACHNETRGWLFFSIFSLFFTLYNSIFRSLQPLNGAIPVWDAFISHFPFYDWQSWDDLYFPLSLSRQWLSQTLLLCYAVSHFARHACLGYVDLEGILTHKMDAAWTRLLKMDIHACTEL